MATRSKHKELIRQFGINPAKPDSFQLLNQSLMDNLFLWSQTNINLNDVIGNFFSIKVRTKLKAILLDIELNNWVGIAASWQNGAQAGQIRIDAKLTELFLTKTFGVSPTNYPFNIKNVNELELNILQTFLSNLEVKMKEFYITEDSPSYMTDLIYLVWLVESEEGDIGRIAFALPANYSPKLEEIDREDAIDINKLANTGIEVPVDFLVGRTKLLIREIKSFESGDLVVLEKSDSGRFYWHLGEIGVVLPEKEHPVFWDEVEENLEEISEEMKKTAKNDEDSISSLPLELSAEFQKVMIPLKQVLELRSGGVLPLGSVLDSELILTAQGKPVAKGELVIIGNQFGMRITEILISTKNPGKVQQQDVEMEELFPPKSQREQGSSTFSDELKDLEEN